uniref:CCHC-type domain-containing protein n=1 Tax=Phytophthora ramorum TaxID=164328 RepID=H3H4T3_PHYRM
MQMVLEERELWEVTSGEVKLEHCTTTADQATFKRKSRKALAIICLAMEDSQLPLVRSAKDAHDAWSRLEGHFEKKSLANKLFLRRRFFTTMMDEGDDVLEHINKLKTLAEQLDAVGAPVSEDDLVITLLGSLSESYQFLITALESRADSLSWELVTSRLLHEDMKRKEQGGGGVDGAAHGQGQAFMTRDNKRKGRPVKKAGAVVKKAPRAAAVYRGTTFNVEVKMQMVLEERELWEVTSGEVKLEHCTTTADQATFKRKSRKALAIICLAMEDSQLPLVRSAKDAHDAWSRLEGHFEKKSLANKLFLRRRFFTTMMDEGDDVLEHINKLKTLAEQLDAVGAPVSEDDLVITLLGSLSESYQFLITALESRADSLSWELVTSRLLHEDMKRKEQGGGGVDGAAHGQGQAFMTRDNKRKGRPVKKTGACHNCGKQGHWIAECPSRAQNDAERYRSQRANVAQDEEDPGDYLFSVGRTSSTAKPSDMWLVDSGATQHMTSSNKYMRNYKTMAPVDVHLADDGVVQAVGTGDIVMSMKTPRGMKKSVLTNVWHIPKLSRNLFSVGRFTKDVGPVTFESDGCFGLKWQLGTREGKGLFKLCMTPMMPDEANAASSKDRQGDTTSYLWHLRLGHIGHGGLDAIVKKSYGVAST